MFFSWPLCSSHLPHTGLLALMFEHSAEYTLQLDGDTNAIRVTDSKTPARMLFLNRNEIPKPGGSNPLREAWNGGYAVEIFYWPASSLKITNILRYVCLEPTINELEVSESLHTSDR